jgi:putative ABC transport system ATP-binding protein
MPPIIETKNLHKTYGTGKLSYHVLKGINTRVIQGEFLAIMGKSGAGKSTLLYQLSGLDYPTQGDVLVNGTNIAHLSEEDLVTFRLNTLGYVFQDYALVPDLDARENIILPILMRGTSWKEACILADMTLETVGLYGKSKSLPSELSGGEQQRVSVARAIVGKPKILFADEPTANLDSASSKTVMELFSRLHTEQSQTIIMVTHEEEYAAYADRIIYLEDGQIISERTKEKQSVAHVSESPTAEGIATTPITTIQ